MGGTDEGQQTVRIFNELVAANEAHKHALEQLTKTTDNLHTAVRAAAVDHVSIGAIMQITGFARSRIYQIRQATPPNNEP